MSIPVDSQERKDVPVFSGCMAYFPDALAEVARLSQAGNDKHNPGQPLHWSRDKSSDHLDCVARHLLESGVVDTDGFLHDVKVAWRALANLQVKLEARPPSEKWDPRSFDALEGPQPPKWDMGHQVFDTSVPTDAERAFYRAVPADSDWLVPKGPERRAGDFADPRYGFCGDHSFWLGKDG